MGCNGWKHRHGCDCGWGGVNYGRAATPAREPSLSTAVWRSFTNPNARCPVCKASVFYHQSENGGRVFFDQLGPPWRKHPCTDRPTWRWPASTEFRLKEEDVGEPRSVPDWQREGWVPVAKIARVAGPPTRKSKDMLTGAIVWSADGASGLKVLWPLLSSFNWSSPVVMRRDPRSRHRVEFETFQVVGDAVRAQRLVAVENDPLTNLTTLLFRLRDRR